MAPAPQKSGVSSSHLFSKTMTAEAKRASGLHTHQRLPQQPWFSPSPLTFSVFTDSVSLVGMLAVGRRRRFRWRPGGAACPGGAGCKIRHQAGPLGTWEEGKGGPSGGDQRQAVLRSQAPPPQGSSASVPAPKAQRPPQEEVPSLQTFPKKSSLGTKLNAVTALRTSSFPWFPGLR